MITPDQLSALRERLHSPNAKFECAEVRALIEERDAQVRALCADIAQIYKAQGFKDGERAAMAVKARVERLPL